MVVEGKLFFQGAWSASEDEMIIQTEKMLHLMDCLNWSPHIFADMIGVDIIEAYRLLMGDPVGYCIAKAFIMYFKAPFAALLIDFTAMHMIPPKFLRIRPNKNAVLLNSVELHIRNTEKERNMKK